MSPFEITDTLRSPISLEGGAGPDTDNGARHD
jgi:hypothetical protein